MAKKLRIKKSKRNPKVKKSSPSQLKQSKRNPKVKKSSPPQLKQSKRNPKVKQSKKRVIKSKRKKRGNEQLTMSGSHDGDYVHVSTKDVDDDFDEEGSNNVYVMWVRHCYSYANDTELGVTNQLDFFNKKVLMQPLCTKGKQENLNYLTQPYYYYEHLFEILEKYEFEELKLYSSILPRAMETSKLIGMGLNTHIDENNDKKKLKFKTNIVQPMNWCSEIDNIPESMIKKTLGMDGSQNNSSLQAHHIYLNDINRFLPYPPKIENNQAMIEESEQSDKRDFYQNWKELYLHKNGKYPIHTSKKKKKTLHLIVSHGTFISNQILKRSNKGKNKIHNLDSFLYQYQIDRKDNIRETLLDKIKNINPKKQDDNETLDFLSKISFTKNRDELKSIFLENTYVPKLDIKKPKSTLSRFGSTISSIFGY